MPSASLKPDSTGSSEIQDPLVKLSQSVEKKIRNLEKRKTKLENYKLELEEGVELNEDQQRAVDAYDGVVASLDLCREFSVQIENSILENSKFVKLQRKKQQEEKSHYEFERIKQVLKFQDIFARFSHKDVRNDFIVGNNGAIQITSEKLNHLEELHKLLIPSILPGRKVVINSLEAKTKLKEATEHMVHLLDGKNKPITPGMTYKDMRNLIFKLCSCPYPKGPKIRTRASQSNTPSPTMGLKGAEKPKKKNNDKVKRNKPLQNGVIEPKPVPSVAFESTSRPPKVQSQVLPTSRPPQVQSQVLPTSRPPQVQSQVLPTSRPPRVQSQVLPTSRPPQVQSQVLPTSRPPQVQSQNLPTSSLMSSEPALRTINQMQHKEIPSSGSVIRSNGPSMECPPGIASTLSPEIGSRLPQSRFDPVSQSQARFNTIGQSSSQFESSSQIQEQFDSMANNQGRFDSLAKNQGQFDSLTKNKGQFDSMAKNQGQFDSLASPGQSLYYNPTSVSQSIPSRASVDISDFMTSGSFNFLQESQVGPNEAAQQAAVYVDPAVVSFGSIKPDSLVQMHEQQQKQLTPASSSLRSESYINNAAPLRPAAVSQSGSFGQQDSYSQPQHQHQHHQPPPQQQQHHHQPPQQHHQPPQQHHHHQPQQHQPPPPQQPQSPQSPLMQQQNQHHAQPEHAPAVSSVTPSYSDVRGGRSPSPPAPLAETSSWANQDDSEGWGVPESSPNDRSDDNMWGGSFGAKEGHEMSHSQGNSDYGGGEYRRGGGYRGRSSRGGYVSRGNMSSGGYRGTRGSYSNYNQGGGKFGVGSNSNNGYGGGSGFRSNRGPSNGGMGGSSFRSRGTFTNKGRGGDSSSRGGTGGPPRTMRGGVYSNNMQRNMY